MAMRKEVAVAATVAAATGIAIAVVWYRLSAKRWKRTRTIVRDFREDCDAPLSKLWEVASAMALEMKDGLLSDESGASSLRMLASPVDSFPIGNEEGIFYGLEMGRTKVCVFRVQLAGKGSWRCRERTHGGPRANKFDGWHLRGTVQLPCCAASKIYFFKQWKFQYAWCKDQRDWLYIFISRRQLCSTWNPCGVVHGFFNQGECVTGFFGNDERGHAETWC